MYNISDSMLNHYIIFFWVHWLPPKDYGKYRRFVPLFCGFFFKKTIGTVLTKMYYKDTSNNSPFLFEYAQDSPGYDASLGVFCLYLIQYLTIFVLRCHKMSFGALSFKAKIPLFKRLLAYSREFTFGGEGGI